MDIFTTEEGKIVPRLSDEKWGMAVDNLLWFRGTHKHEDKLIYSQ